MTQNKQIHIDLCILYILQYIYIHIYTQAYIHTYAIHIIYNKCQTNVISEELYTNKKKKIINE